jgi:hypothetical protein
MMAPADYERTAAQPADRRPDGNANPRYEEMTTVEGLIEDAVTSSPLPVTSTPIHH